MSVARDATSPDVARRMVRYYQPKLDKTRPPPFRLRPGGVSRCGCGSKVRHRSLWMY